MAVKFKTDPFGFVARRVTALFPDAPDVDVEWVDGLHEAEGAWGRTHFDESPVVIEIDSRCPVAGAFDVFVHELAHVIAGFDAGHEKPWEQARDEILADLAKYT